MRNILFTFLIFSSYFMQAQIKGEAEYLVKYEVDFVLDSTNREDIKHEIHRLYTGSTTSNYISEGLFYRDSIMQVMRNQPRENWRNMRGSMQNMPRSEFNTSVFKNLNKNEVWVQHNLAQDQFLYQEEAIPLQWEFTDDSKMIEQYLALKAITSFGGRDYEAWFTLEIPILDGPYVFNGVPGLILELYDTNKDYHFNLVSIQPLKDNYVIDSEKSNSKQVSKKEFIQAYKKFNENPSASFSRHLPSNFEFKDNTGKTITRRDLERQAKENAAKRNNLIEKW